MRAVAPPLLLLLLVCSVGSACSDDEPDAASATTTTTTTVGAVDVCDRARETIGVADPPVDLVEVAALAAIVADLATAPEEPLHTALASVSDAAALLTDAARAEDAAAVGDAAATLSAAYDELDLVAAELGRAECTSESWGRQVAIAAIDLVGAGG